MIARAFERMLLASRWVLAPFFVGLGLGLLALLVKAGQDVFHMAETILSASEHEVVLSTLGLVELTLAASLVLIIMFSGYENFIGAIAVEEEAAWPAWLAKIDFTGMKLKVLASVVTISAIELLRDVMSVGDQSDREMAWAAGSLLVFVVSGLLLALTDKMAGRADH